MKAISQDNMQQILNTIYTDIGNGTGGGTSLKTTATCHERVYFGRGNKTNEITALNDEDNILKYLECISKSKTITVNSDSTVRLKKGKTYKIQFCTFNDNKTDKKEVYAYVKNAATKAIIGQTGFFTVSSTNGYGNDVPINTVYTPTEDIDIGVYLFYSYKIQATYTSFSVEEIGENLIIDPFEVKDNHDTEYYSCSEQLKDMPFVVGGPNAVQPISSSNQYLKQSTNMEITADGFLKLKKGKLYNIIFQSTLSFKSKSGYATVGIVNKNTKAPLTDSFAISPGYALTQGQWLGSCHYKPTEDVEIGYLVLDGTIAPSSSFNLSLRIEEVATPVVVEYNQYHEVSNPLTAEQTAKGVDVGTIGFCIGLNPPAEHLLCDGKTYNIADYPELAKWIFDNNGIYNPWGGDGVTTFKVPDYMPTAQGTLIPKMTSNTLPAGTVFSSSVYNDTRPAWMCFDGDVTTSWLSAAGAEHTIGYQFVTAKKVVRYSIQARTFDANDGLIMPNTWTFEGFNGTSWVVLDTQTNITFLSGEEKFFPITSPKTFIKYQLRMTKNNGFRDNIVGLGEFKMFAEPTVPVQCIRYKSTKDIVNQYGGFQSTTLWEGYGKTLNEMLVLSESIDNFDFIEVFCSMWKPDAKVIRSSKSPSNLLNLNDTICIYHGTVRMINLQLIERNKFKLIELTNDSYGSDIGVCRIVGIKGEFPTLLQGGTL